MNILTFNSEHRLSQVLDEQIFKYKLVSTFSFFKRFKKVKDLKSFDESKSHMETMELDDVLEN